MANLDDLGYKSITDMTVEEGLELIRQIRLGRRVPAKKSTKKPKSKKLSIPDISPEKAEEMLKILLGK